MVGTLQNLGMFSLLVCYIANIPIGLANTEVGKCIWHETSNAEFPVQSTYELAMMSNDLPKSDCHLI